MKIQRPGGPAKLPHVESPDAADKPQAAGAIGAPSEVERAAGADPIAALARGVASGAISGQKAVEQVLDLATRSGALAALPEAARAKLKAQLEALLKEDPYLLERARRVGAEE